MIPTKESIMIMVLIFVVAINLYDLYVDIAHGATRWHLFEEVGVILASSSIIVWLAFGLLKQQRELAQLKQDMQTGPSYSSPPGPKLLEARQQLSEVIQEFLQWNLTTGEREVALLLLKGLSFKEIAAVRDTLEKTVRQQASGIYKKSGVNGRHGFSAWFIEDFL